MSRQRHLPAVRRLRLRRLAAGLPGDPAAGTCAAQGARLLSVRRRHRLLQLGVAQVHAEVLEQVLQTVSGVYQSI